MSRSRILLYASALIVLAGISTVVSPADVQRRRAVERPAPLQYIIPEVEAGDVIHIQNHGEKTDLALCMEACESFTLDKGQSMSFPAIPGEHARTMEVRTKGRNLEIRATGEDGYEVHDFQQINILPVTPDDNIHFFYGDGNVQLRGQLGSIIAETIFAVEQYGETTRTLDELFPNTQRDDYMQLEFTGGAYTATAVSRPLLRATGEQFVLGAEGTTAAYVKNDDKSQINVIRFNFFPHGQENDIHGVAGANLHVNNYGMEGVDDLQSLLGIEGAGMLKSEGAYISPEMPEKPHLLWVHQSGMMLPVFRYEEMALGSRWLKEDQRQNLTFTAVNPKDDLYVAETYRNGGSTDVTITGYDIEGNQTEEMQLALREREQIEIPDIRNELGENTYSISIGASDGEPGMQKQPSISAVLKRDATGEWDKGWVVERNLIDAYTSRALIRVRDNGKTFEQRTKFSPEITKKLQNVNNVESTLGSKGYYCGNEPDPVVNTIDELVTNYRKLSPAEQQEFSGDRAGFEPFVYHESDPAGSACDSADPDGKYISFIGITTERIE